MVEVVGDDTKGDVGGSASNNTGLRPVDTGSKPYRQVDHGRVAVRPALTLYGAVFGISAARRFHGS
jgi:hypothetical protein